MGGEGTRGGLVFSAKSGWWIGWFLFVVFQDVRGVSGKWGKFGDLTYHIENKGRNVSSGL